jgi:DNA-binding XRE family transcriptional regulator
MLGLSQEVVAERAGITVRGLHSIEKGRAAPRLDTARALVSALGVARFEVVFPPPPKVPPEVVARGVTALASGVRRRNPGTLVEVEGGEAA